MSDSSKPSTGEKVKVGPIVIKNKPWEWFLSALILLILSVFMCEYHRWRGREYFNVDFTQFLYVFNKGIAIASTIMLAISLASGSLRRLTGKCKSLIRLRRTFGLVAVCGVMLHIVFSLVLTEKFGLVFFRNNWLSMVVVSVATIGFIVMAVTSYRPMLTRLGPVRWKAIQTMGWLFLIAVLLHMVFFVRVIDGEVHYCVRTLGWIRWFRDYPTNKPVPPGGFFASFWIIMALLVKLIDIIAGFFKTSGKASD